MLFSMILGAALAATQASPQQAAPGAATAATVSETEVRQFAVAALVITRA